VEENKTIEMGANCNTTNFFGYTRDNERRTASQHCAMSYV